MRRSLIVAACLPLVCSHVFAQDRFLRLGGRAEAMGGAFTAVADDATAFHWNPAGIALAPIFEVGFFHGRSEMDRGSLIEGLGAGSSEGRLFVEEATGLSFGFTFMGVSSTWFRETSSTRAGGRLVSEGRETFDLAVSLLHSLPLDNLIVAANLHYLRTTSFELSEDPSELDGMSRSPRAIFDRVRQEQSVRTNGWALDLASIYEPNPWLRVGVMLRDLNESSYDTPSAVRKSRERHARAGVSFRPRRSLLVAADVDLSRQGRAPDDWREVSIGIEKSFFSRKLFARAGVRAETGSRFGARPAFAFGAGARLRWLVLDVAYLGSSDGRDEAYWIGITASP